MKQIIKASRIKIQLHIQTSIFVSLPRLNVKDCIYYYIDLIVFFFERIDLEQVHEWNPYFCDMHVGISSTVIFSTQLRH